MAQVEAEDIIAFIQTELANVRNDYKRGKIDLKTLQAASKPLNNAAQYIAILARQQREE
jgi:hypothetical protein